MGLLHNFYTNINIIIIIIIKTIHRLLRLAVGIIAHILSLKKKK